MEIPEDILVEILVRLRADSLMRFKCVSKLWSSLISSRYFTNLFFKYSSSTNPKRHVFVQWNHRKLFSSSLCNLDATNSFLQLNPDLTLLGNRIQNGDNFGYSELHFVNAMRGLMCFRDERAVRIINFTTRQILILPQVDSNILMESDGEMIADEIVSRSTWNYLGYDPVNDEYKLLSTIRKFSKVKESKSVRSETQVLVLGAGASWRNTKSLTHHPPHHYPDKGGIPINGILYYGAWSNEKRCCVLMSFDFNSEEFILIELPSDNRITCNRLDKVKLMNYRDQVAALDDSRLNTQSILDLWVLEDAGKSKWSHKFFVLPCDKLRMIFPTSYPYLRILRGTSRSGEVTLCARYASINNKIAHALYDLKKNRITRVVVFKRPHSNYQFVWMNIWDDVESIMYLEP